MPAAFGSQTGALACEALPRGLAVTLRAASRASEPPVPALSAPAQETDVERTTEKRLLLLELLTSPKEARTAGLDMGLPTGRGRTGEATKPACRGKGTSVPARRGYAAASTTCAAGSACAAMSFSAIGLRQARGFQSRR